MEGGDTSIGIRMLESSQRSYVHDAASPVCLTSVQVHDDVGEVRPHFERFLTTPPPHPSSRPGQAKAKKDAEETTRKDAEPEASRETAKRKAAEKATSESAQKKPTQTQPSI